MAMVITPIVIRFCHRFKLYDSVGVRKVHSGDIARIGGVVIFVSMITLVVIVLFLPNRIGDNFRLVSTKIVAVLACGAMMFVVGLFDDIKSLPMKFKLFAQIIAAVIVCSFGVRIEVISVPEVFSIQFGWFSWPFTILWIVGVTNAVNFIDGLDGLAAGICSIACGVIAVLAFMFGQSVLCVMMLAMAGALMGFLFFNFSPAKIFMGDCGSLFLGFTIASATVMCTAKSQALVGLALPVLALGIPIFDTLFIMMHRFGQRRSVFAADKEHLHHRLLKLGLKQKHVVITAYLVTLLATGAGLFMMAARSVEGVVMFVSILVLLVLMFHLAGAVSVKQLMRALNRKYHK